MSYPFYCHAATHLTASQHPCRLSIAAAAVAAPFLLFSNPAFAALNCTEQPTCSELGYSKSDVDNCDSYVFCPFDTTYKACVKEKPVSIDCSAYPLKECPDTAEHCSACGSGTNISYKVDSCKSGYTLSANTCVAATCFGYTLSSCPANGNCSDCLSGTTKKYKLNSCKSGYIKVGNSCYKTYASCSDAGYESTDLSSSTRSCSSVSIYLTNGSKTTCYECSSISSSSGSGGSSGGNTLADCLEKCADNCNMNIENCSGYDACVNNCRLNYGSNTLPPKSMLAFEAISENQCRIKYVDNLKSAQSQDDCPIYNA